MIIQSFPPAKVFISLDYQLRSVLYGKDSWLANIKKPKQSNTSIALDLNLFPMVNHYKEIDIGFILLPKLQLCNHIPDVGMLYTKSNNYTPFVTSWIAVARYFTLPDVTPAMLLRKIVITF